jgi:hypothetical protein
MSGRADMRVGEHGTIDAGNAQSEPEARVTDDWPAAYERFLGLNFLY